MSLGATLFGYVIAAAREGDRDAQLLVHAAGVYGDAAALTRALLAYFNAPPRSDAAEGLALEQLHTQAAVLLAKIEAGQPPDWHRLRTELSERVAS